MIQQISFFEIQALTEGTWINQPENGNDTLVGGAFDTRKLANAEIFFAWKGDHSDAHSYLHMLQNSSIRLAIVEKDVPPIPGVAILKVVDSLKALHTIARELSHRFQGKVITITGSSGKTTAKTWLAHLLGAKFRVLTNEGSFNNHIGCPITILNLKPEHEVLILEMGTSGIGELELLTSIAPADISILLNVGHAHLGKFGSIENTYRAKLEIFSHQKAGAISLIPYQNEILRKRMKLDNRVYFGTGSPLHHWDRINIDSDKMEQEFQFSYSNRKERVRVNQMGEYVGELLSGMLGICEELQIPWENISQRLTTLQQEKGRSHFLTGINGVRILDDSYNANPESVINMLQTISSIPASRRIAVIGNLAELDEGLESSAVYIKNNIPQGIHQLYFGGETGKILTELIQKKRPDLHTSYFQSHFEIIDELKQSCDEQTIIGIKGSRSSHMERVVLLLCGTDAQCRETRCGKLLMCSYCDLV